MMELHARLSIDWEKHTLARNRRQVHGGMEGGGMEKPNREMYSWHYFLTASMQVCWMGVPRFGTLSTVAS